MCTRSYALHGVAPPNSLLSDLGQVQCGVHTCMHMSSCTSMYMPIHMSYTAVSTATGPFVIPFSPVPRRIFAVWLEIPDQHDEAMRCDAM